MIQDSTQTPSFIEDEPNWNRPVIVTTQWSTGIVPNRDGGEQRSRRRNKPVFALTYERSAMTPTRQLLARITAIKALATAGVVPIWTHPATLTSLVGSTVTLTAAASIKFKVGSWLYFKQTGLTSTFRKIQTIAGAVITLAADVFPGPGTPAFTSGAAVYPCILGMREENSVRFRQIRSDRSATTITVEEL